MAARRRLASFSPKTSRRFRISKFDMLLDMAVSSILYQTPNNRPTDGHLITLTTDDSYPIETVPHPRLYSQDQDSRAVFRAAIHQRRSSIITLACFSNSVRPFSTSPPWKCAQRVATGM